MFHIRPGSIPCPNCHKLISSQSAKCIYCGIRRPGLFLATPILGNLIRGETSFVDGIVLFCFMLYLLSIALDIPSALKFGGIFGILSPSTASLYKVGLGGAYPLQQGRWWTLITATYLHGSILHILFNMLWLRQIGFWVEDLFGPSRFLIIYTLAGLVGSLVSTIAGTQAFVGASGAIMGLFGAMIYYGRNRGGTLGSAIFRQVLIWAGIAFVLGLVMPGIDNWGHAGGFVGGFLVAMLLGYQEKKRQTLWQHIGATLALAGIAVCFIFMLITFFRG